MARSEKMVKEVVDRLIMNGYDRDEAYQQVDLMRTNELVKVYYHPSYIKAKVGGSVKVSSMTQTSRKITDWGKYV